MLHNVDTHVESPALANEILQSGGPDEDTHHLRSLSPYWTIQYIW